MLWFKTKLFLTNHSQCNRCVKRLSPYQTSAVWHDWADALPCTFIRLYDNDRLGTSQYELIHGHHGRTELDLIYAGYREKKIQGLSHTTEFAENLGETLI